MQRDEKTPNDVSNTKVIPSIAKVYPSNAKVYLEEGVIALNSRKFPEALDKFNVSLTFDDGIVFTRLQRGLTYLALRNIDRSIEDFNFVIDLSHKSSNVARAYLYRSISRLMQGDKEGEKKDLLNSLDSAGSISSIKLFCGIRLLELNALPNHIDLTILATQLADKLNDEEDMCILICAQIITKQFEQAKNTCQKLLKNFSVAKIPIYLQCAFVASLINPDCWPINFNQLVSNGDKQQLLDMIQCLPSEVIRINAALQGLCHQSLLGKIFDETPTKISKKIPNKPFSGMSVKLAVYLNDQIKNLKNIVLIPATIACLKRESLDRSSFALFLQQDYPFIHKAIKSYLAPSKFFFFNPEKFGITTYKFPSIQAEEEEGNRFILDL